MSHTKNSNIFPDLISIIVPIYNAEKTIENTLDTILQQTYFNIEVILINDGSTDNSKKICEKICKKDGRVQLFTIENKGPSFARQYGFEKSTGKFIAFCDSDDQLHPSMIEKLYYAIIENNCSLSICGFSKTTLAENLSTKSELRIIDQNDCIIECLTNDNIAGYLWNKMFRSDIIKSNDIRFDEDVNCCEDLEYVIHYLKYCSKIAVTEEPLYLYVVQENSLSSGGISWNKLTSLIAREKIYSFLKEYNNKKITNIAKKILVEQTILLGRKLEKSSQHNLTTVQYKMITKIIKNNCRKHGLSVIVKRACTIKQAVNILRFGYIKKW